MLGIVFAGHSGFGSGMMKALMQLLGARPIQCIGVEFSDGVSSNMLSRMMCDALHQVDSGDGVVIIADILGAPPFRAAALMCHKHPHCEVVVGVSSGHSAESVMPSPSVRRSWRRRAITSRVYGMSRAARRRYLCRRSPKRVAHSVIRPAADDASPLFLFGCFPRHITDYAHPLMG